MPCALLCSGPDSLVALHRCPNLRDLCPRPGPTVRTPIPRGKTKCVNIDITVHEVLEGGKLKELLKTSSFDKEGQTLKRTLTKCLREFFSESLWDDYERNIQKMLRYRRSLQNRQELHDAPHFSFDIRPTLWDFIRKHKAYPDSKDGLSFYRTKDSDTRSNVANYPEESPWCKVPPVGGRLRLRAPSCTKTSTKRSGRSSKSCVRSTLRRRFLRGAVTFGRDQSVIKSRKSPYTYGFSKIARFDASKHKPEKRISTSEGQWCRHLFRKMVEVNEDVGWDESREFSVYPLEADQQKLSLDFYRSKKREPLYVDEEGVEGPVASCDLILPKTSKGLDQEVKVKVYFGSTTITAVAVDLESQTDAFAKMNFITH
ncbi:hypothetical protein WMY93_033092 [Mugilogobius chulae]|uniref:Uncharacterized protein n=1 Tax=Mugilogobius chulae TaxID=88201 RepID=A0AAW0ML74_9GOBI